MRSHLSFYKPTICLTSSWQYLGFLCQLYTKSFHTLKAMQNSGTGWVKNPQLPTVVFYLQSYSSSCPKLSDVKQNARGAGVPGRRNTLKFPFPAPLLSLSQWICHTARCKVTKTALQNQKAATCVEVLSLGKDVKWCEIRKQKMCLMYFAVHARSVSPSSSDCTYLSVFNH